MPNMILQNHKTAEHLRYPIGKFHQPEIITRAILSDWIAEIHAFPSRLIREVQNMSDEQLDTPYRKDGWTIRQVVHHCADSHMNGFIRLKLTLTENEPTIKPFYEELWAVLGDSQSMPIAPSLKMLEGIHERWSVLLYQLTPDQCQRFFIHPEQGIIRIDEMVGLYAWHCNHHLAHIIALKQQYRWT
mgnify:CR=1 FL=1